MLGVLLAGDGLKSSDVAARGWSSPGTVTTVVDTLGAGRGEGDPAVEARVRDEVLALTSRFPIYDR